MRCALLFALCLGAAAAELATGLKPNIEGAMREGRIPSLTIALVNHHEIIWASGYGYSNLWARTPAVPETVYLIGSTFKAMSAVALLQQMDRGKFRLDDAVNPYLTEVKIRRDDPARPVTFRHLLTHTSGLPPTGNAGQYELWQEPYPRSMIDYLRDSLELRTTPMEELVYSNLAFTLVALLVEKFAGVPFRQYIRENIFQPLSMHSTAFSPTPHMQERMAVPYVSDPAGGAQAPVRQYRREYWPAGLVYGTAVDQAKWLIANLNGGEYNGKRILPAGLLRQMHTRQNDKFMGAKFKPRYGFGNETTGWGLAWIVSQRHGDRYIAHSGSVPGYTCFLLANLDRKLGVVLMTNGNRAHSHLVRLAEAAIDLQISRPPVSQIQQKR